MARPTSPRPTDAELAILRLLWERGASTVREIHAQLNPERPIGYTTVLKALQIMHEKRLVVRDERERTHVYRAAESGAQTQRKLVDDLVQRAFGGSAAKLLMSALSARRVSRDELKEIEELVRRAKKGDEP